MILSRCFFSWWKSNAHRTAERYIFDFNTQSSMHYITLHAIFKSSSIDADSENHTLLPVDFLNFHFSFSFVQSLYLILSISATCTTAHNVDTIMDMYLMFLCLYTNQECALKYMKNHNTRNSLKDVEYSGTSMLSNI